MCSENYEAIKGILVLKCDKERPKNMEILELELELGFFLKKCTFYLIQKLHRENVWL